MKLEKVSGTTKLCLVNVSKSFDKDKFEIFRNINLSVKSGKFVCIMGPSGCGKTILLYLIAGFLKPTSGKILMENEPILGPDSNRMMVFQHYVLFPWMTVYENIIFALDNSRINNEDKHHLVMKYLDLMGIKMFKNWYPYKLSGGMKQRVALARALITNPQVLLLDEPFSSLDPQYRKFLAKKLEEISKETKKTIIFVSHDVNESVLLADEIYLLSSRPTRIKKVYHVKLSRPRNPSNKKFVKLSMEIEKELQKEFEIAVKNPLMENSLQRILKLTGERGIL